VWAFANLSEFFEVANGFIVFRLSLRLEIRFVFASLLFALTVIRAVGFSSAFQIADTSLVVVAGSDFISCLVSSRSASILWRPGPIFCPVADNITFASIWEVAIWLITASKAFLSWHAEELKPLGVVFATAARFAILGVLSALDTTIDDVGSGTEGGAKVFRLINSVWLVEACHDIMHAWLGVLGGHVEPDACSHG